MKLNLESQCLDIFKDAFAFYGTISPEGFLFDFQGEIFEEAGIEQELLIGHKFSETVFWQSQPQTPGSLQNAIDEAAKGNKNKIEIDFRLSAQRKMTVRLSLFPVRNELGSVAKIFFYAEDVTDKVQQVDFYKDRAEHLLYAAESAEIGLWFWDLEKDEIFSTPKCNEFYELNPHEIISYEYFVSTLHEDDRERVINELREAQVSDTEYNVEYRVIYSDDSVQWLAVRGKTFYDQDKNPVSMMGVVRRITDKKIATAETDKINDSVRQARDEAEEANRAKDHFLAIVSHELRSPLNSILGWAKILLTKEVDADVRRNALETIERSAKSQAKLMDDLVDSSRIASGKLRLELRPVNLYEIVKNVYNSQKPTAESKKIDLEFQAEKEVGEVYGDSMRLQQVFSNLLTNALKFTPENGKVTVNYKIFDDIAEISVADTGQGISPDALPTIFRQFAQADEKISRDKTGLGLGLAIVKTLIEKHEGNITVESEGINRGAKFTVTLPLIEQTIHAQEPPKAEENGDEQLLQGIKILVVEDDQDSREVLQLFLEQSGAQVESAKSAADAWKLLTNSSEDAPDVIVSDLAMPVEDGYSFITRVRHLNKKDLQEIPAMALSAFASPENKAKAIACGFQLYHTKPFEPDGIVKDILLLLDKR